MRLVVVVASLALPNQAILAVSANRTDKVYDNALTTATDGKDLMTHTMVRKEGENSRVLGATSFLYPEKRDESMRGLYLMGFGAIDIVGGWSSAGIIPAIQMAIDDVNDRPDILAGYQLIVHMRDSKVG